MPTAGPEITTLRILCIGDRFPRPDEDAGSLRMAGILKVLRGLGHAVTFYSDELGAATRHLDLLARLGVATVSGGPLRVRLAAGHLGVPDAVIVSRLDTAILHYPTVRHYLPASRVIFDTVDLHHVRYARQASLTRDRGHSFRALVAKGLELALTRDADLTWVVSAEEQRTLAEACPGAAISVVSTIHEPGPAPAAFSSRAGIGFVGGFNHQPNVDAVTFFVRDVMPRLRDRLPGVTFSIVGADAPAAIRALEAPDVRVLGHVPDLEPLLAAWRVFVAPIRYGAGVKGKIGEALSHGLPTVTTSIGAEGMALSHDRDVLVADTPEGLATAIAAAHEDPACWARLSGNGRAWVAAHLSPEVAAAQIRSDLAADANRADRARSRLLSS